MKSKQKITGMSNKDKEKMRQPILNEIKKLVNKFGLEQVAYTIRWYVSRESAKISRKRKILELKKQIKEIDKGKNPAYC